MSTEPAFGARLKALRKERAFTMQQLADKAGVGQGTISELESGKVAQPSLTNAQKLAAALDVPTALLLGEEPAPTAPAAPMGGQGEWMDYIPLDLIDFSPLNPRRTFDEYELAKLADSIAEKGVLQPVMLRPNDGAPGRFWLVMGERRIRAAKLLVAAGRPLPAPVPARVRLMTDEEHVELALVENMQRADVPPMEEAESIARLVAMKGGDTDAVAKAISRTRRHVQVALNLVEKLTPEVHEALRDGTINKEMARQLTVADHARQLVLLSCVRNGNIGNGKEMRERMQRGNFPATKALFGRLEYNGPVVEDPDSDAVIFTDMALVKQLQIEAMKAKAKDFQTTYPVVKTITDDDYWDPQSWRATEQGFYPRNKVERMPSTAQRAVVLVLRNDLSVSIYDDLVKMPPPPTTPAGKKQAAKDAGDILADFPTGAKMHARRARTMALQRALLAEEGNRTLLAHLCLNLLGGDLDHTPMLAVRPDHRVPDVRVIDPDVADIINEFRENLEFMKGEKLFIDPSEKDPYISVRSETVGEWHTTKQRTGAVVLEALYDLDGADLLELAMALLAARAGTWFGNGQNGEPGIGDQVETLSACKKLGLVHAVADNAGTIDWPAYLERLNGPAMDVLYQRLELRVPQHARPGWPDATQKDKRRILLDWTADRPDKAAYIPAIFRYGSGEDIDAAMRTEANAIRQPAKAAE